MRVATQGEMGAELWISFALMQNIVLQQLNPAKNMKVGEAMNTARCVKHCGAARLKIATAGSIIAPK